jgi:hypothetical protein
MLLFAIRQMRAVKKPFTAETENVRRRMIAKYAMQVRCRNLQVHKPGRLSLVLL